MPKLPKEGDLNLPPGVMRGSEFFGGKRTIEAQGARWAARRRAELPETQADLIIMIKESATYLELPLLRFGDQEPQMVRSRIPRAHPITGSVYTARVVRKETEDLSDGEERLRFVVIGGRRFESVEVPTELTKEFPRRWKVLQVIPQEAKEGIEAAMRQADEIGWDYGPRTGVEQARIETVLESVQQLSQYFAQGEIRTDEDLKQLALEADSLLASEGLTTATGIRWKRILEQITKAAKRDSMNRINPTVSRIRARSALLTATEGEVLQHQVRNKWVDIYNYLNIIRLGTHARIISSMEALDQVAGITGNHGIEAFREGNVSIEPRPANYVSQVIKEVSSQLGEIQVNPYLPRVRFAQTALTGDYYMTNSQEEIHRQILNCSGYDAKQLFSVPSAEEHLRQGRAMKAYSMIEFSYTELADTLEAAKLLSYTVFSNQEQL